ncbi:hypothetical protein GLU60_04155 [Nanohaloarchaea archaeon H01]|nr:hypothetical protein [Nanohaloarchaea archaeon H01]
MLQQRRHGQTVQKKVFEVDVGEVSEPVKTEFGWHLIKKTDEK